MATTSLSLGEHWENFIKREVASGRYGSASEVVRDALRHREERNGKLAARVPTSPRALPIWRYAPSWRVSARRRPMVTLVPAAAGTRATM